MVAPTRDRLAADKSLRVSSYGRNRPGCLSRSREEGRNGATREGREEDRSKDYRATIIANGHERGGKKKKRKSCENSKSLARNRQQIDSNIANCCYVMFHHPRGIDRGLGRVGSREMHGIVKIERYFSTRQQVGM